MSSELSAEEIKHHVKVYVRVFIALAVLTLLTVGVSYLHLNIYLAVAVALLIATFKGSLVATFFMHLVSERKIILWILGFTVFFFFFLLLFPTLFKY